MILLLVICATSMILAQADTDKKVVCYWKSWSVTRNGDGKFGVSDINPKLCTHLIYTFIGLSESGEVLSSNQKIDFAENGGENNIAQFNQLREQNPALKTMVAIGGRKGDSAVYSNVVADPKLRRTMVESIVNFVKKYNFDGFDLDWEYPTQRGGSPTDKQNYAFLLKELRERFNKEGLLLSAAVAAPESSASKSYNIPEISKYLHFINLMTFDLHGSWEGKTGIHAPFDPASSESGNDDKLNIESIIKYWISAGAPTEKLVLGIPLYGQTWTLSDPQSNGIGASASGAGAAGPYTEQPGTLGYNEICEKMKNDNWQMKYDERKNAVYAYGGNQWVVYDDMISIKLKAGLIKKYNLGGGMVMSIDTDDFRGKCGTNFPLLRTLSSDLRNEASLGASDMHPVFTPEKSQSDKPPQNQPNDSQKDESSKPQQDQPKQPGKSFSLPRPLSRVLRNEASPAANDSHPIFTEKKSQPEKPSHESPQNNPQQCEPSKAQPEHPKQPGNSFPHPQTLSKDLRNEASPAANDSRPIFTEEKSQPEKLSHESPQNNPQQHEPSKAQPEHPKQPADDRHTCIPEGFFKNPSDGRKIYWCYPSNNRFIRVVAYCPDGTRLIPFRILTTLMKLNANKVGEPYMGHYPVWDSSRISKLPRILLCSYY